MFLVFGIFVTHQINHIITSFTPVGGRSPGRGEVCLLTTHNKGEYTMKQPYVKVPNTIRYIASVALATRPADTLAVLVEIGAITGQEIGLVRQMRETLNIVGKRWSKIPKNQRDAGHNLVLYHILTALNKRDVQAYLAYRLRDMQTCEDLIETLGVIFRTSRHRRPWQCWREPDEYTVQTLRYAMLGKLFVFHPQTRHLTAIEYVYELSCVICGQAVIGCEIHRCTGCGQPICEHCDTIGRERCALCGPEEVEE